MSISTVVILVLTAIAAVTYALSGLPVQQTKNPSTSPPSVANILIPDGVGSNPKLNFQPSKITVVIGINNTIVWTDQDSSAFNSVAYVSVPIYGERFGSGALQRDQTYSVTLTVPGIYKYQCAFHPGWMFGTIIVKAA